MLPARTGNPTADMAAIMAKVRKMSDSQLADILAGKDVSVPQFAAMTEAMGRKQLRQAVDGAQAMQQAKQPSVKDQLLADQQALAGIDQLPAANMESMDMAAGGIIAFEEGGRVPTWEDVQKSLEKYQQAQTPWYLPTPKVNPADAYAQEYESILNAYQNKKPYAGLAALADTSAKKEDVVSDKKDDTAKPAAPAISTTSAAQPPASSGKKDRMDMPESQDYFAPIAGVGERIRGGIADLKNAKQSDFLLGAAKALLGNATLAKAGSDFAGTAMELGAKTRKEVREAESAADAYDFNMAKAREAAAQGNKELALKYQQLADLNAYHMGSLGIQGQKLGMLKDQYDMVKIPAQLSKVYADAKKEVDAAYNNMVPASKRAQYQKDIEDAYRKRAGAVGLGKYVDTYSPSTTAYNVVQSPRKGANVLELDEI